MHMADPLPGLAFPAKMECMASNWEPETPPFLYLLGSLSQEWENTIWNLLFKYANKVWEKKKQNLKDGRSMAAETR